MTHRQQLVALLEDAGLTFRQQRVVTHYVIVTDKYGAITKFIFDGPEGEDKLTSIAAPSLYGDE